VLVRDEIESMPGFRDGHDEELVKEQARMETLILDAKAKQKHLEPKLIKLGLANERVKKYEDLIVFLDGEIAHFQNETETKLIPDFE
jgi:hypothetical protein